jgi:septal ring factor EnvC (AmiA/AmiB activator)
MAGDTDLEKKVNAYLTCQFVCFQDIPDDECLKETRHLIQLFQEHNQLAAKDAEILALYQSLGGSDDMIRGLRDQLAEKDAEIDRIRLLRVQTVEEIQALRKVAEAAKGLRDHGSDFQRGTHAGFLWAALAELDRVREGKKD